MTKEDLRKRAETYAEGKGYEHDDPDTYHDGNEVFNCVQSAYIDGILDFARLMMQTELDKVVETLSGLAKEGEPHV